MLDSYRRVLTRPGALAFTTSGFLGRLPLSMLGLGLVLLVAGRTGSYSLAGSVSAALVLSEAAFAITQGRLIDLLGQGRFLPITAIVFAGALALAMAAVQRDWPLPLPHVFAGLAGAAMPAVGSCVRARWTHLLESGQEIHTAYSFEAVVDECVFVVGPPVVTLLATAWHPLAGLTFALVAGLVGTLALAAQKATEPPSGRPRDGVARPALPWRIIGPLAVVCLALGCLFGSAEVSTVALSEELGHRSWSGPLLAIWAFGSLLAGLVSGAMTWRSSDASRILAGATALTLLMSPLLATGSFVVLGVVLFLAGFAISPTLIATMSLAQAVLPRPRLTEGMAVLSTGIAAGVALGAPLAGLVIDRAGASTSYAVTVGSGALAAATALLLPHRRGSGR